jgi:hypothetical protein
MAIDTSNMRLVSQSMMCAPKVDLLYPVPKVSFRQSHVPLHSSNLRHRPNPPDLLRYDLDNA